MWEYYNQSEDLIYEEETDPNAKVTVQMDPNTTATVQTESDGTRKGDDRQSELDRSNEPATDSNGNSKEETS